MCSPPSQTPRNRGESSPNRASGKAGALLR
jgi:hypothetical protein